MIELTEQQQHAVDAGPPPRLIDPRTKKSYVLVSAELYDRYREQMETPEGLDMRQVAVLVENAMREEDQDDPTLDFYQEKYGKKP